MNPLRYMNPVSHDGQISSSSVKRIDKAIERISQESTSNLVLLHDRVHTAYSLIQEMGPDIEAQVKKGYEEKLAFYRDLLEQRKSELLLQQKWCELLLPMGALTTDPDCVEFLMRSQFAYLMILFNNDGIREVDGALLLKMDGKYRPWNEIRKLIYFDENRQRVVCRDRPELVYNYTGIDGIVQKDLEPHELYPVDQLSQEKHTLLMNHAKTYWQENKEADPDQKKECVIQIVSSQTDPLPRNWLTENFNDLYPTHNFIRLIDKDGMVYSFGSRVARESEEMLLDTRTNCFAAGYAKIRTPDFDESRYFDKRSVTSVPITTERLQQILQFSGKINQEEGIRFCFSKQNCSAFAAHIASIAGVEIESQMTFGEMLSKMLPKAEKIPLIGGGLKSISDAVAPIFTTLDTYTPAPIKQVASLIEEVALFIPRKVKTIFFNVLILAFGGCKEVEPLKNNRADDRVFKDFSRLLGSIEDFFADEVSDVHHSWKLIQWQQKQPSTVIYRYTHGPKMYV